MTILLIFAGQFLFSLTRTAAVSMIAAERAVLAVLLNMLSSLIRLLVLTGGIIAVMGRDWLAVVFFVVAGAAGDALSLHLTRKPKNKESGK